MAKRARSKRNEKLAPQRTISLFPSVKGVLISVGKPFYYLLSFLVIVVLYTSYFLGSFISSFAYLVTKTIKRSRKLKRPKVKVIIPRLKIAKLPDKLTFLRLRLKAIRFLSKIRRPKVKIKIRLPLLVILAALIPLSLIIVFWAIFLRDLPSPKFLTTREIAVSTKIYDRNGLLLYKIYKDQNRTIVPLPRIPLLVRQATLAIEDAEFYSHPGFSLRGILRALIRNIKTGELTGGSTITQQLVKNTLLSPEKTFVRKVRELILSVWVEQTFTKDEILEMYLNQVSYGGTAYGIEEASRVYFAKDVGFLTLGEAALLAGLPKSPTKDSPFGPNPQLALDRQKEVLRLMVINKYITQDAAQKALSQPLKFAPNKTDIKAPHFVMYVRQILVDKFGEEMVEKGGLEVVTTLDYQIQKLAEEVVVGEVNKLAKLNVGNAGALVVEPKTGDILAMVGSKDYFDTAHDGNVNVTTALRQPGSSIKIINYAYALANGYNLATILSDSPVTFSVPGQPPYSPKNYDGNFRGNLPLRNALAESRNIPAVKVLASYGVSKMLEEGQKMGITSWNDPSRYGLSLTLGGGEVRLIDLAKAYATIANYGKRPEFSAVKRVSNYKGKVLDTDCETAKREGFPEAFAKEEPCEWPQVLDARVAFLLIDVLRDNKTRAPAFGNSSQLVVAGRDDVAVKTGTSNDLRDNLTLGFNQDYLVAVWVGNNDNSPMARIASGVTGAAPIWNKIMSTLLEGTPNRAWEAPQGLTQISVCTLTGTLPCESCPTRSEWFLDETKPTKTCLMTPKQPEPTGQILEPAAKIEATAKPPTVPTPRKRLFRP